MKNLTKRTGKTIPKTLRRMISVIPANIERKDATGETPEAKLNREIKALKDQILEAVTGKADISVVQQMQRQLDAVDISLAERHVSSLPQAGLKEILEKNDGVQRLLKDKR